MPIWVPQTYVFLDRKNNFGAPLFWDIPTRVVCISIIYQLFGSLCMVFLQTNPCPAADWCPGFAKLRTISCPGWMRGIPASGLWMADFKPWHALRLHGTIVHSIEIWTFSQLAVSCSCSIWTCTASQICIMPGACWGIWCISFPNSCIGKASERHRKKSLGYLKTN